MISDMNTKYQYYLMSNTPAKEKRFAELKKKYGTRWAFHGSALCNWHAIFRKGLKNVFFI
jgi:poly [ADP-ribose] polymerase 6/8